MKKIVVILISLVLLSSCNSKEGISGSATNQDCEAKVISMEEVAELLKTKQFTGIQFIDIRTPHEYTMGHLPEAINIPMKNFFDEDRYENINTEDMLILYGDDTSAPKMMGLLAGHFKKGEFHVAMGGYEFLKEIALNDTADDDIYIYDDEIPIVDFQKEIDAIVERSGATPATNTKKKPTTTKPLVIRKKKAVSGGCG